MALITSGKFDPYEHIVFLADSQRFEAFDEPWKVIYNTPGQSWEDKWGLMDSARKIKPGLKIPSCGGKTAS